MNKTLDCATCVTHNRCTICKKDGHKYLECPQYDHKTCHICNSETHMAPECTSNDGVYLCDLCGRTGHYSKYCRWVKSTTTNLPTETN